LPGSPPPLWLKSSHSWRGEAAGDGAGGDEQNDGQNLIKFWNIWVNVGKMMVK